MPSRTNPLRAGRLLAIALVLLIGYLPCAYAYIDPNTTGTLYQLLFPAFIAVASAIAALRRSISHLCSRVLQACLRLLGRDVTARNREPGS